MTISYRTVCAGVEVKVKGQKALDRLFRSLGGRVIDVSDKDITMRFPSIAAGATFIEAAKLRGAIIDRNVTIND